MDLFEIRLGRAVDIRCQTEPSGIDVWLVDKRLIVNSQSVRRVRDRYL